MRSSPLLFTLIVAAALAAASFPLRALTGRGEETRAQATEHTAPVEAATSEIPAALRLLAPARSVSLALPDGSVLWSGETLEAGTHDLDLELPDAARVECLLRAVFESDSADTAVFLTLMPDKRPAATAHAIGRGEITSLLVISWPE